MSAEDKIIFKYGDDNANPRFEDSYYVSNWVAKVMYLKKGAKMDKKGVTIVTPIKLFNGDIFYTTKYNIKYYVINWEGFNATGGHIQRIGRLDGHPLTQVDLDNLTAKTKIRIRGHVKNKCTTCD